MTSVNREVAIHVVFHKTTRDDPDGCQATAVAPVAPREETPIEQLAADMERLLTSEEHADVEFEVVENAKEEKAESVTHHTEWTQESGAVGQPGRFPFQLCGGGPTMTTEGHTRNSHQMVPEPHQQRIYINASLGVICNPRGTILRAHKAILTARVPYFERLFASGMKEAETNRIRVEDVDADTFRQFLLFIYAGKLPENVETHARAYLPLSEKYDVKILKRRCEETLERQLERQNLVETLVWADLYRCEKLKETCLKKYEEWRTRIGGEDLKPLKQYPQLMFEMLSFGKE